MTPEEKNEEADMHMQVLEEKVAKGEATPTEVADFKDREQVKSDFEGVNIGRLLQSDKNLDFLSETLPPVGSNEWEICDRVLPKVEQFQAGKAKPPNSELALFVLACRSQIAQDQFGEPFLVVGVDEHKELWPLRSRTAMSWLSRACFETFNTPLGAESLRAALECFAGYSSCRVLHLENRVAFGPDGALWYDLTNPDWQAVRITPSGWSIEKTPLIFRRETHQRPQALPVKGGNAKLLLNYLPSLSKEDEQLVLVSSAAALIPDIPKIIEDWYGAQGSGKTVGLKCRRLIIDPSTALTLSLPRDKDELVLQLHQHYAPVYDNVTDVPGWVSDIFCRASTGGGNSKRRLYTDDGSVVFDYIRPISINGISQPLENPDVLDRALLFEVDRIDKKTRKEEKTILRDIEKNRAIIFGGFCDTLSKALSLYPSISLPELPRMADFAHWGEAISRALGYPNDSFLEAYMGNVNGQFRAAVEGSDFGSLFFEWLQSAALPWNGTPTKLWNEFRDGEKGNVPKGFPKSAASLSKKLRTFVHSLVELGYLIEFPEKEAGGIRTIAIRKADSPAHAAQLPEPAQEDLKPFIPAGRTENHAAPLLPVLPIGQEAGGSEKPAAIQTEGVYGLKPTIGQEGGTGGSFGIPLGGVPVPSAETPKNPPTPSAKKLENFGLAPLSLQDTGCCSYCHEVTTLTHRDDRGFMLCQDCTKNEVEYRRAQGVPTQ